MSRLPAHAVLIPATTLVLQAVRLPIVSRHARSMARLPYRMLIPKSCANLQAKSARSARRTPQHANTATTSHYALCARLHCLSDMSLHTQGSLTRSLSWVLREALEFSEDVAVLKSATSTFARFRGVLQPCL